MTCKELIEILKEFDADVAVRVADDKFEYPIIDVVKEAGDVRIEFENDRFENESSDHI